MDSVMIQLGATLARCWRAWRSRLVTRPVTTAQPLENPTA